MSEVDKTESAKFDISAIDFKFLRRELEKKAEKNLILDDMSVVIEHRLRLHCSKILLGLVPSRGTRALSTSTTSIKIAQRSR